MTVRVIEVFCWQVRPNLAKLNLTRMCDEVNEIAILTMGGGHSRGRGKSEVYGTFLTLSIADQGHRNYRTLYAHISLKLQSFFDLLGMPNSKVHLNPGSWLSITVFGVWLCRPS